MRFPRRTPMFNMKKIHAMTARRRYDEGETILVCPKGLTPESMVQIRGVFNKDQTYAKGGFFERVKLWKRHYSRGGRTVNLSYWIEEDQDS